MIRPDHLFFEEKCNVKFIGAADEIGIVEVSRVSTIGKSGASSVNADSVDQDARAIG